MNLHAVVRGAISSVNPDMPDAVLFKSHGYDTVSSGKQIPKYAAPITVSIQVQAMSTRDLMKTNFLNLQGTLRAVYMYGATHAIVRPLVIGGDVLEFALETGSTPRRWLVVSELEPWGTAGWCKLAVQLQQQGASAA